MKYPYTEFPLYEYTFIYGALSFLSNALKRLGTVERFAVQPKSIVGTTDELF